MDVHKGSDICVCGDFYSQHDNGEKCRVCFGMRKASGGGCSEFRFSNMASREDQETWDSSANAAKIILNGNSPPSEPRNISAKDFLSRKGFCETDWYLPETLCRLMEEFSDLKSPYPTEGAKLIIAERSRQVSFEGWTPEHDDSHQYGELAKRAAALCVAHTDAVVMDNGEQVTPWKSHPCPRSLVIAGALIAAEIDHLQRLAKKESK